MNPKDIRSAALREAYEKDRKELAELAKAGESSPLTDEQKTRVGELKASIQDILERAELAAHTDGLAAAEAPAEPAKVRAAAKPAAGSTKVEAKSPYAKENVKASWFRDLATLRDGEASRAEYSEAKDRLQAHYESAGDEASARVMFAYTSTTDTEGGYLVAPAYLQSEFIELVAAGRVTADLAGKYPLLPKTDSVNIPTMDGATAVAAHTENNSLTETSATFNTVRADVVRLGGKATIPNFLLDRSMPGADQVVLKDLSKRYAIAVDDIVLNSSTTYRKGFFQESGLGGATATAGTATIGDLWPAILNAVNDVAAGFYKYPTSIVMHPRRWAWMLAQVDSDDRPILGAYAPQNAVGMFAGSNVAGAGQGPQASGQILGIPVYLDARIPTTFGTGTDEDRIIVGCLDEAWLMETQPKFGVSMDALFGADQTLARVTGDIAFTCARQKAAVSIISGTALNDTI